MFRVRSIIEQPKFGLVRGAKPVRRIKPRIRRASLPGIFPTSKGTRPFLRTESLIELDGLELLEIDPDVVLMAAQPHQLLYWEPKPEGGTVRRSYVPDLALLKADGSVEIIDFKPAEIAAGARWQRKSRLLEDAYRLDHRATFLTITDEMIAVEPRRHNAKILMLHREVREDEAAKVAVLARIERVGLPASVGDIRRAARLPCERADVDRAFSALLNLVVDGLVALDMSVPLTDESIVTWRPPAAVGGRAA